MLESVMIEQDADIGYAVRRNGTILLRTASDTDWQAMGNGLVLVFDADPQMIDWAAPAQVRRAWQECVDNAPDELQIVRVRAVEMDADLCPRNSIAQYLDNQAAMRGRGLGRALRVMASNVRAGLDLQEEDEA